MPEDNIKNLQQQEAIEKIRELVKSEQTCMFATHLTSTPVSARPMSTSKADGEGNLWFFSSSLSHKNRHIESDPRVQLFYSNPGSSEFISLFGTAIVTKDRDKIEEYWSPIIKAWFPEGKDDPSLTLIKVTPEETYYWDTKHGKMVSILKIMTAVVTGKIMDDGVEGKLEI